MLLSMSVAEPSSAWVLAKMSNMAEDASTFMTKVGKNAQNLLDQAGNWTIVKKIGKGFAETKEWINENVSSLKSFAEDVQEDVDAYKKIYEDSKQILDENLGGYLKISEDIKNLQASYEAIMLKISETEASFKAQIEAQKSTISGQIDSCNQNMSNLKKLLEERSIDQEAYEKEYNEWNEKQQVLVQQIDDIDKVAQEELDSIVLEYKTELSKIKSQINQLKSDLSKLAGLEEEQSDEDALLNTTNIYFLQYDEDLNPERQDKIRYNRLVERRNSIITAYEEALTYIPDLNTKDDEAEDLGYNASLFDTTAGAWGASAEMQIKKLKALSAYAHLLVQDIKRKTAVEMSNLTFYKLQKPQKNITEFNLDDYVYEQKKGDK